MPRTTNKAQSTTSFSEATPTTPATETISDIRNEIAADVGDTKGISERGAESAPKRRGRPPGSKSKTREAEPPAVIVPPEVFAPLIDFPFNYYASRKGEHWKLSDEERTMLSQSLAAVANKYAPMIGEKWGPEIVLVLAIVGIVTPRAMVDAQIAKAEKQAQAKPAPEVAFQ